MTEEKPAYGVTTLVGCPYFTIKKTHVPELEYAYRFGREMHETIEDELRRMGLEVEVPVALELNKYKIIGKIDAIDRQTNTIYEIKPNRMNYKGFKQLLLYRDILYVLEKKRYRIGLILYRKGKFTFVKSFLHEPKLLSVLKYAIQVAEALYNNGEVIKIASEDCKYCKLRDVCKPDYTCINGRLVKLR